MSEGGEDNNKKAGGWGGFANIGASLKDMGSQMEEKLRAQQAQFQEQQNKQLAGSKHGGGSLGGSKHGGSKHGAANTKGGGLMSRLGGGLNKEQQAAAQGGEDDTEKTGDAVAPSTPSKDTSSANPSTPAPVGTTPLSARSPDDVSKEELLEILKKMNTRVKALSQSRVQLSEKVKQSEKDKARLLAFVKNEILDEDVIAEATEKVTKLQQQQQKGGKEEGKELTPDEVTVLQTAWRASDERNQLTLQHIQNEYKVMTMQANAQVEKVRAEITAEKDGEIMRMKQDMKEALNNIEKDGGFGFRDRKSSCRERVYPCV